MLHTKIHIGPDYAERSFFDGDHSAHCAAWQEERRLQRIIQRDLRFAMELERSKQSVPGFFRLAGK